MCDSSNDTESQDDSCSCTKTETDEQGLILPFTAVQLECIKNDEINLSTSTSGSSRGSAQSFLICDCAINDGEFEVTCACAINNIIFGISKDSIDSDKNDEIQKLSECSCTTEESSSTSKTEKSSSTAIDEDKIENTLAIIKPEAMMFRNEIERTILDAGFFITQTRWLLLTPEQVIEFYRDYHTKEHLARLLSYMSSGPIVVFIISKINAIREWKLLMGPKKVADAKIFAPDSIRGKFGRLGDDVKNVVHGSADKKEAEREIHFFFPDFILEPILEGEEVVDYLWKRINKILSEGLIKCCEAKPSDPVVWLGNWLLDNDNNRPKYLLRRKSNLYD